MLLNKHPNDYKAEKPRKDAIRKIKEHLNKGKKYNISASDSLDESYAGRADNIEENLLHPTIKFEVDYDPYFVNSKARVALRGYSKDSNHMSFFPALAETDFECPLTNQYQDMIKNPKKFRQQKEKVDRDRKKYGPGRFGAYNIDDLILTAKKKEKIKWVAENIDPHDNIPDGLMTLEEKPYPKLRSDVTQYLGLLKQYLTALCGEMKFEHGAIDIVPYSQTSLIIFIATPAGYLNKLNTQVEEDDDSNYSDGCYRQLDDILTRLEKDKVRPPRNVAYDNIVLYRRNKRSRFQYLFENRLSRIEKEISSLNKLQNTTNYSFAENDFRAGEKRLRNSIGDFNEKYMRFFVEEERKLEERKKTKDLGPGEDALPIHLQKLLKERGMIVVRETKTKKK